MQVMARCAKIQVESFKVAQRVDVMHFDVFTLFPTIFAGPLDESILKRAQEMGRLSVTLHDIRDYAAGKHRMIGQSGKIAAFTSIVSQDWAGRGR